MSCQRALARARARKGGRCVLGLWKTRGWPCMPTLRGSAALMASIDRRTGGPEMRIAIVLIWRAAAEGADMAAGCGWGEGPYVRSGSVGAAVSNSGQRLRATIKIRRLAVLGVARGLARVIFSDVFHFTS